MMILISIFFEVNDNKEINNKINEINKIDLKDYASMNYDTYRS